MNKFFALISIVGILSSSVMARPIPGHNESSQSAGGFLAVYTEPEYPEGKGPPITPIPVEDDPCTDIGLDPQALIPIKSAEARDIREKMTGFSNNKSELLL